MPGVYRYFDAENNCLYVGKARDLKKRVSSYFQKSDLSPRIALMVSQVQMIETTVVRSEAEALLLENNLIKTLKPKYNILFRDDKSYPYLKISAAAFPRVSYYRGEVDKKSRFFGPYPNAQAVKEAISLLQRVFKLRTCEEGVFKNRSRPCLMGQMGRCSAPCVGALSREEYAQDVESACSFLRGRTQGVLEQLQKKMQSESEAQRYEEAAKTRDKLSALADILHEQSVETTGGDTDADIVALAFEGDFVCVNLAMVRGGRHLGDHAYFPEFSDAVDAQDVLEAFLLQHYESFEMPRIVIADIPSGAKEIEERLKDAFLKPVTLIHEPQEVRRRWLEMAKTGAQIALARHLNELGGEKRRLSDLVNVLALDIEEEDYPQIHIECFDISHTSGEATQASCVVFREGAMDSSRYRRFNITSTSQGDDYAAMREVLTRRYSPVARGEAKLPTLVLVDGGKGQVAMATEVFGQLGLPLSVIVGVAKGEGRKTGLETLVFADERPSLTLGSQSPALMLIAMIRDEAHRFAITGMRAKRSRTRQKSQVEEIEGIGAKRRQALLTYFGGFKGLKNASCEDIAKVNGISVKLAERIYAELHGIE